MPDIVRPIHGAFHAVMVRRGMKGSSIMVRVSRDNPHNIGICGFHHYMYVMYRDLSPLCIGNDTWYVVVTVIEVKAKWWGCLSMGWWMSKQRCSLLR